MTDLPHEQRHRDRVLLISEDGVYPHAVVLGGTEIHGEALVKALEQAYDVLVLTKTGIWIRDSWRPLPSLAEPGRGFSARRAGVKWALAEVRGALRTVAWRARVLSTLRALARLNVGLVYLKKFHSMSAAVLQLYLSRPVPVIAEFGDRHLGGFAQIYDRVWRRCSAPEKVRLAGRLTLVFNCAFLRDFYEGTFGWPVRRVVIYHGVDASLFHPPATPLSGNHWMFLGRASKEKGFLDFCRAMAALPRPLVDSIRIVASGPALPEGLAILQGSGRGDLVPVVGPQPREAVPSRLREATILVHPSYDEGLPASVMEAMASGLAVVASDAGGTPEVVHDGETGLLVPRTDLARLVRACRSLAEDPGIRQRLGRAARAYVLAHHNVDAFVRSIREVIAEGTG